MSPAGGAGGAVRAAHALRQALLKTGSSTRGLAAKLGVAERTMRRWIEEPAHIPVPVMLLCELLAQDPKILDRLEPLVTPQEDTP